MSDRQGPMILSHAHKFIYIKTYKTGSTSIEAALSAVCGPDDVITEASEQLRGHRQQPAQNYRIAHPAKPARPILKRLLMRPEKHYHPSVGFYEHMPAWRVKAYVEPEIWRSYYKFTFERNPWDRQVSWYHYKTKSKSPRPSFSTFNRDRKRAYVENYDLYTIDGAVAVDFIGQYERLEEGFETVLERIGLKGRISLPKTNVSKDRGAYREYYEDDSRALVGDWYDREIALFGYEF